MCPESLKYNLYWIYMVNENNESNAVDLEMNWDVSAGYCMRFFFFAAP